MECAATDHALRIGSASLLRHDGGHGQIFRHELLDNI